MSAGSEQQQWADRAEAARAAVAERHLRRLWLLPGTQLGVIGWPSTGRDRAFARWHYWWQAHLIDCLVDAHVRAPDAAGRRAIAAQIRAHRLRNLGRWTNSYYDDMAWLALALDRADRLVGVTRPRALTALTGRLTSSWVPEDGGGIPWRTADQFFNAPANGPAGIVLARRGHLRRASAMADWLDETLVDPETHLIFDGIKGGSLVRAQYTYCQGVVLGLETELAVRTDDARHGARVVRLLTAVRDHMTTDGVVRGVGGGDGGLFAGILVRYLALVATDLPGDTDAATGARTLARELVTASARAVWETRQSVPPGPSGLPLFSADWTRPAQLPSAADVGGALHDGAVAASVTPERDLSVQLSAWMTLEAAHTVASR